MRLSQLPKRVRRPDPDAKVVQQLLDPLAQALAQPDEPSREAAVMSVCQAHAHAGVGPLIDALVELLGREEGPVRGRALAYLGRFGPLAMPSLSLGFVRTESATLQRGISAALTRIAGSLDRGLRLELVYDVAMLWRFAVEPSVRLELGKALGAVRRANEKVARNG
jgi:hypothetical protein